MTLILAQKKIVNNSRNKKSFALLTRKRSAHRAQNCAVERQRLIDRAHHVRQGDCTLERGKTFDGARDDFRLERLEFAFEGESEKLRVVGRVREAIGAFFLQKCAQNLITSLYDKLRELARRNSTGKYFVLRFVISFQEMTTTIQIVADASEWARKSRRIVRGCTLRI